MPGDSLSHTTHLDCYLTEWVHAHLYVCKVHTSLVSAAGRSKHRKNSLIPDSHADMSAELQHGSRAYAVLLAYLVWPHTHTSIVVYHPLDGHKHFGHG